MTVIISACIDYLGLQVKRAEKRVNNLYNKKRQLEDKLMPLTLQNKSIKNILTALQKRYNNLMEINQEYRLINHKWIQASRELDSLNREHRIQNSY